MNTTALPAALIALSIAQTTHSTELTATTAVQPLPPCPSYQQVSDELRERYGERLVFSGFADQETSTSSTAVYEIWASPSQNTWTLIANKLVETGRQGRSAAGECTFIIDSGRRHQWVGADRTPGSAPAGDSLAADSRAAEAGICLTHDTQDDLLRERHRAKPILRALSNDATMVEIYAGPTHWSLLRTRLRALPEAAASATSSSGAGSADGGVAPITLCSAPLYSGRSWGVSENARESI